jgi:hypothetical protein
MVAWRACKGLLSAAAIALVTLGPAPARADGVELGTRLSLGQTVTYDQTVDNGETRYVGGVTYTVVSATPEQLQRMFEDVAVYTKVLPATRSARLVARRGPDFWVELAQGNGVIETKLTLVLRRLPDGKTVRFWLDTTRPHGIEDAWGFFRAEALPDVADAADAADGSRGPRALLTYAALLDVGPGLVRGLFEERLRRLMLSVPQRIAAYAVAHQHDRPFTPGKLGELTPGPVSAPALLASEPADDAASR